MKQGFGPIMLAGIVASICCGCCVPIPGRHASPEHSGRTTHHLIIGLGIVSCRHHSNGAVVATKTEAIGLSASDRPGLKLGVGYSSSTVVSVADGAEDVRVEVSDRPAGPFTVEAASVQMKTNRQPKED